jgi:hypothetical protein
LSPDRGYHPLDSLSGGFECGIDLLVTLLAGFGCRRSGNTLCVSSSLSQPLLCGQFNLAVEFG